MFFLAQIDDVEVEQIVTAVRDVLSADQIMVVFLIIILFLIVGTIVTYVVLRVLSLVQIQLRQQQVALDNNTKATNNLELQQMSLAELREDMATQTSLLSDQNEMMRESVNVSKAIFQSNEQRNQQASIAMATIDETGKAVLKLPELINESGDKVVEDVIKALMAVDGPLQTQFSKVETALRDVERGLIEISDKVDSGFVQHGNGIKHLGEEVRTALSALQDFRSMVNDKPPKDGK